MNYVLNLSLSRKRSEKFSRNKLSFGVKYKDIKRLREPCKKLETVIYLVKIDGIIKVGWGLREERTKEPYKNNCDNPIQPTKERV